MYEFSRSEYKVKFEREREKERVNVEDREEYMRTCRDLIFSIIILSDGSNSIDKY